MESSTSQQQLKKTIGTPQAVALYIGAVIGSGVLIVPGLAAEMAGPASLLAWGFMTLLILPMALSMGLLSAKYPNAGGVSHFVTLAFGPRAGAVVGWFFLMSVPIGAPVAALTGAGYLTAALGWGEHARIVIASLILVCGLLVNWFGMKLAGGIQIAVVIAIAAVLLFAFAVSVPQMETAHFTPFLPHGWFNVGQAAAILFWCFIGWEAVSHMSEEFKNPQQAAVRGVMIAAAIVGLLYFLSALAVVGTGSYLAGADTALVHLISAPLGHLGALIVGVMGIFICTATIIAYAGAASRVAYALAREGHAPAWMSRVSGTYHSPAGGLLFLGASFILIMTLYGTRLVSLTTLIQLPNAAFILTYLCGCAAGIRLLKDDRRALAVSWISFISTAAVFPFTGWAMLYPCAILVVCWAAGLLKQQKSMRIHAPLSDQSQVGKKA